MPRKDDDKDEIAKQREELDRIIKDWGVEEGFRFLKKELPTHIRKAVLKDNDTTLDILFDILFKLTKDSEKKQHLYIIAQIIEMSDFTAKFKINKSIVEFFNSITDRNKDPSKQIIKQAIRIQGGNLIEFYTNEITRVGHILGTHASVTFKFDGKKIYGRKSEGGYHDVSINWFHGLIKKYRDDQDITKESKVLIARFERALAGLDPELKIIPTGFHAHAIYVAFLGDKLILSNRGARESMRSGGVKIFKLKTGASRNLDIYETAEEFEIALAKIVDLDKPEKVFVEIKSQANGNCTFANLKGLITPYLYLSVPASERENVHNVYKLLTNWMRSQEVDRLIFEFNAALASHNEEAEKFYAGVLMSYTYDYMLKVANSGIIKKKHSDFKIKYDTQRLEKVLKALADYKKYKPFVALFVKTLEEIIANMPQDAAQIIKSVTPIFDYLRTHRIEIEIMPRQDISTKPTPRVS